MADPRIILYYGFAPVTDPETAKKLFDLIDAIEESDEVQNVYGNFDVSDEVMEKAASL